MSSARRRDSSSRPRVFEATEPRRYDRKFYAGALLVSVIVITLTAGFAVYMTTFNTSPPQSPRYYDFSSFINAGRSLPDPKNPAIVLQQHLESIHLKSYRSAYDDLCSGLRKTTGYDEFVANAGENQALFQDISSYDVPDYEVHGTSATASGYVNYAGGGRSKVQADFAREGDDWKIAIMTLIYE